MHVAELSLCKELYRLSGWDDTEFEWGKNPNSDWLPSNDWSEYGYIGFEEGPPAYDLGYLLRKLPKYMLTSFVEAEDVDGKLGWTLSYRLDDIRGSILFTMTPEDALAKLVIELIKQGFLVKKGKK